MEALKGVSFGLNEVGLVFVLGRSGSGKSTLLNIIGCLDQLTSGSLIIDGIDASTFAERDLNSFRSQYIGFIFQDAHMLADYGVGENIALALAIQDKQVERREIAKALADVGLEGYYDRNVDQLSGGQRQRVAIARALVKDSRILLADEPTGSLDFDTAREIFDLLALISKHQLVVVVSHDREAARMYANRIITLEEGKVMSNEANAPASANIYLEKSHLEEADVDQINEDLRLGRRLVIQSPQQAVSELSYQEVEQYRPKKAHLPLSTTIKLSLNSIIANCIL